MIKKAHKVSAIFFVLWGLVHILGGALMLQGVLAEGANAAFNQLATALTASENQSNHVMAGAVLGFHAYNIIWLGALTTFIAVMANWRFQRWSFYMNLAIVAAADLGLIIFMLAPGYMAVADGLIGIVLFILAAFFAFIALRQKQIQFQGA